MECHTVHQVRIQRGEEGFCRIAGSTLQVDTKHARHIRQRIGVTTATQLWTQLHRYLVEVRQTQGVDDGKDRRHCQHLIVQLLML